jgi:hypothetical protein
MGIDLNRFNLKQSVLSCPLHVAMDSSLGSETKVEVNNALGRGHYQKKEQLHKA